jgi:ABC-type glycerol-3-phosphate transport system substrate-binding protein
MAISLCGCGTKDDGFQINDDANQYNVKLVSDSETWNAIVSAQISENDCTFLVVEGNQKKIISHYMAEEAEITGEDFLAVSCGDGEDIYMLESGQTEGFRLVRLSRDGQVICATDIVGTKTVDMTNGITDMDADADGNIYITWNNDQMGYIEVFSSDLELLCSLETNGIISSTATTDGSVYCLVSGTKLVSVDLASEKFGSVLELGQSFERISSDGYHLYLSDGSKLWYVDLENRVLEAVFSFSETGIGGFLEAGLLPDDQYLVVTNQGVYSLEQAESEDGRTVIHVAVDGSADTYILQTAAIAFNKDNEDYRVEITEYDDEDIFLTQLTSGDIPDMFFFPMSYFGAMAMDAQTLAEQGYLLDIYELLDADEEYSRDTFVSSVLKAGEMEDGCLYNFPVSFGIDVASASSVVVGDRTSWTPQECLEFLQESGFDGYLFGPEYNQSWTLYKLLTINCELFVDRENGICNFDSKEFKALLELVKEYAPEEMPDNLKNPIVNIRDGEQLLYEQIQYNINYLQILDGIVGDPVYIGLPSESGNGNAVVYDKSFGISAYSQNLDVVWSFAKTLFDEEYLDILWAFPVVQEQLDEYLIYGDDDGWVMESGDADVDPYAYSIELTNATEQDRVRMRELIEAVCNMSRVDKQLVAIIQENAQEYFLGQKTVDEVAEAIQSRVSIYLSERLN